MLLSVLVPTVPRRLRSFYPSLMEDLLGQIGDRKDIELIGLFDNKVRSVGQKRNELLKLAQGKYIVFVDDDDHIDPTYISSIMPVLERDCVGPDVVVFDCITTVNGGKRTYSQYSKQYDYVQWPDPTGEYDFQWRGLPPHTAVWKRDIALRHAFNSVNYGEDVDWVKRAVKDVLIEERIDKVLYYYNFNDATTETRC